ncbi:MAG TPA: hypothetical protein VGI17_03065 [Solirubrobacterales bacterium]|jgi:hypothetical protein
MWRWPAADPREVVDLAGAGGLAEPAGGASLGDELRRWRGIVARRRLVALARRDGTLALGLAVVLEIAAQLGAVPQWVAIALPLVGFLVAVTIFALRGPSPFQLARLLDDKLGLNDRLATALEIEARGGARSALERRTVADAAGLLAAGREDWHAGAAGAGREWWAPAGAVAAIAVVVAIGALSAGNSSSGPVEALGPQAGAGAGNAPGEHHPKHRNKHEKHLAPTGKLHKFKSTKGPQASAEESAKSGYQKIPQGYRTKGKEAKGHGPKAGTGQGGPKNAPTGKLRKEQNLGKPGSNEEPGGRKGQSSGADKEKEHPTVGFNVKGQKKGGGGRKGNSKVSGGAGNKPAAPNGQGDETSATPTEGPKGTAAGANHAGGEQGTNQQGHATPIKGQASQAVRIQPSYAPSRATKGGKEKSKTGHEQGAGGKARTAQVTGVTQVGDQFSFVPVTGGAVPGPSTGLQLNYLESLKWVERLPWG